MFIFISLLQLLFQIIFFLPAASAVYLMRFAGETLYQLARFTPFKKQVSQNIKLLFPQANADRLADKLLRNVSYSLFEVLCFPFFKEAHLKRICKINGIENVDLGLAGRKGILILLMHTGNYELAPIALKALRYKVNSVLKAPDELIFRLLNRSRTYRGVRLINVLKEDMYKESLRALGDNEIVGMMIDTGALEGKHETIDFLGRKMPAATGWLALAQRSGAAVVTAFSKREGKKVVLSFGEPLAVDAGNREAIMEKVKSFYESFIRSQPEQWAIFLNSYETRRIVGL